MPLPTITPSRIRHSAARRFCRWLAGRGLPVRADLIDAIPGFDPRHHRVHDRHGPADHGRQAQQPDRPLPARRLAVGCRAAYTIPHSGYYCVGGRRERSNRGD